jgi:hypothetical protein
MLDQALAQYRELLGYCIVIAIALMFLGYIIQGGIIVLVAGIDYRHEEGPKKKKIKENIRKFNVFVENGFPVAAFLVLICGLFPIVLGFFSGAAILFAGLRFTHFLRDLDWTWTERLRPQGR